MSKKKDDLTPFLRVLKYIRPQWPRVVAIVIMVIIIAMLYSLSFMTIGPLLKVMMGEEGLHGWIDRKVCNWRYGMDFKVPELVDFTDGDDLRIKYYLQVRYVDSDEPAWRAGIRFEDQIIGVGDAMPGPDRPGVPASELRERLAGLTGDTQVPVMVQRTNALGVPDVNTLSLTAPPNEGFKGWTVIQVQNILQLVPRGQARETKRHAVIFVIVVMLIVTIVRCVARFAQNYLAEKVEHVSVANLREDCFAKVMRMPVGCFSVQGTSDTISRIYHDTIQAVAGVKILLGKALREPMKAIGLLGWAMYISPRLCLIFLVMAPATFAAFGILGSKMRRATKRTLVSSAVMLGRVTGVVKALRVVKVYNNQKRESEHYRVINQSLLRQTLRIAKVRAMTNPLMEVLGMFAGSAALIVGAYWVTSSDITRQIKPSDFLMLLVLLGSAAESLRKVSDVWNKIQAANAASERVFEIIDQPDEHEIPHAVALAPLKKTIEFRHIEFTYPGSDEPVLKDVTLTINAGETVAVVGPNGSGKTTLINLLPRFYDPDKGAILIDGQDVAECTLASLRNQIGMVTQDVVTFNESVRENIAYGKQGATQEDIDVAAKRSFALEFIEPLPNGYDTVIGENNAGFSGGQLQRIVIARAIVQNPGIMIFDEAMSQIDADSEAKIHKALEGLMQDRTCFVIAHRFSTVVSADRIVVMKDGHIAAQGTHAELIDTSPLYRSLYETQLVDTKETK